jgi:hypothetical protein
MWFLLWKFATCADTTNVLVLWHFFFIECYVNLHLQIHSARVRNETEIVLLFVSLNFKSIEIMILVLDSTSKKKLSLLKELALEMGVKVTETSKKSVSKPIAKEQTLKLAKEVNKTMTKKLFAKLDIDYDSYNRQ